MGFLQGATGTVFNGPVQQVADYATGYMYLPGSGVSPPTHPVPPSVAQAHAMQPAATLANPIPNVMSAPAPSSPVHTTPPPAIQPPSRQQSWASSIPASATRSPERRPTNGTVSSSVNFPFYQDYQPTITVNPPQSNTFFPVSALPLNSSAPTIPGTILAVPVTGSDSWSVAASSSNTPPGTPIAPTGQVGPFPGFLPFAAMTKSVLPMPSPTINPAPDSPASVLPQVASAAATLAQPAIAQVVQAAAGKGNKKKSRFSRFLSRVFMRRKRSKKSKTVS